MTKGANSRIRRSETRVVGPAMLTVPTAAPSRPERTAAAIAVTPGSASFSANPYPRRAVVRRSRRSASIDRMTFGPYPSA